MLTFLQIAVVTSYVTFIYKRYGKLTSISASTYYLEGNARWWFLAFLWSVSILNLFQGMEVYGFLGAAGLGFSGITIDHESSSAHSNRVHQVGTVTAIVAMFVGLWVIHGFWLPTALLAVSAAFLYKNKYFIWWIEIIAFSLVFISYLVR